MLYSGQLNGIFNQILLHEINGLQKIGTPLKVMSWRSKMGVHRK